MSVRECGSLWMYPRSFFVKVSAPVILTVNLSKKFVNGLSGEVMRLFDESVEVYFYDLKETMCISYHHFLQFCNNHKAMRFVIKQIPLILSFAMTIHKSQGMTLPSVHVDCQGAFAPGQISVALCRVRKATNNTVTSFREGLCPPHPSKVQEFNGSISTPLEEDISWCHNETEVRAQEHTDPVHPNSSNSDSGSESEIDEEDIVTPPSPAIPSPVTLPTQLSSQTLTTKLSYPEEFAQTQKTINHLINSRSDASLDACTSYFYNELMDIATSQYREQGDSKQINTVITTFIQKYRQTAAFNQHLQTRLTLLPPLYYISPDCIVNHLS